MQRQSRRGWLLVGLIVLISAVILALAGVTFFLTEHRRNTSLRQNQTKAIYLAQAGIMRELYDYRRGQEISLEEQTVTEGPQAGSADDDVFQVSGPDADFLLVNMRGNITFPTPFLCPSSGGGRVSRDRIDGWFVRNVLAEGERTLRVDSMRVNWDSPVPGVESVLRIDLNNSTVWTASPCNAGAAADAPIDINDRTINPGVRWTNNRVWFATTNMEAKAWIDIVFVLSDGTEYTAHYEPGAVAARSADFTLRSRGTVRRGAMPFELWRRLRVAYRVCIAVSGKACSSTDQEQERSGAIVGYQELSN